jgi:hypothetical protein
MPCVTGHLQDVLVISRDIGTFWVGKYHRPVHTCPIQYSLDLPHGQVPPPYMNVGIDNFHDGLLWLNAVIGDL